jgi:serine/threonine-protein kinase
VAELSPGTEFAGCRIDGIAGRGGMGVVYCATELRLDRPVALKLIAADRAADHEFRERFDVEARLAASLDHPNVIPVYAAGEQDGRPYLVMRLVQGTDLHRLVQAEGPLAPARAAAIIAQVASALDAAHASGLVHRDVKPANVLLDAADHVYLTDFGLTRLAGSDTRITETGQWLGTVDFASPEQLEGQRCDARSDVYALGCVLFHALTGRPPFVKGTVPATINAVVHETPPRPSALGAPRAFDRVLARALAKHPADRFPSAGDFGRAALAAALGEHVTTRERTVAVGPAAPSEALTVAFAPGTARTRVAPQDPVHPLANGAPERVLPPPLPPRVPDDGAADDEPPPVPITHRPGRWRARAALAGLAVVGLGLVGTLGWIGAGGGDPPPEVEAVTDHEVRLAVDGFSKAYSDEDARALGRLLTADVERVLPAGAQRGRAAVVREYAAQFAANRITAYDVADLSIRSGDAGRAEGSYTVRRKGAPPFGGRFVLGVVKERGRVRIRLIAATPT